MEFQVYELELEAPGLFHPLHAGLAVLLRACELLSRVVCRNEKLLHRML